jgi:hypothetical protein
MVDNLYGYGFPDAPITEARRWRRPPQGPAARRARPAPARRPRQRAGAGHHRALRDYYGPGGENSLLNQVGVKPGRRGQDAARVHRRDQPHTFHYLPDAARGFATLVEHPEADGRIWILPAAPAVTQDELYRLLGEVLGRELKVGRITPLMLRLIGLVNRS